MPLDLVQAVAEKTEALRWLEAAYQVRTARDGERAVGLDGILEIARQQGFLGHPDLAAGVLRHSGRYLVRKGSDGRWAVLRLTTTALATVPKHSTALVPVAPAEHTELVAVGKSRFVLRAAVATVPARRAA